MEDVPDASTQLHSILKFYVNEFRRNQDSFKAHLNGRDSSIEPLLPSFLPPSSYWTSAEKDLFFHALSVYSRLQPELIAQHVKTKSTFDVCVYLEVLKSAAESIEDEDEDTMENSLRTEMEPAMEVSEKWVLREEAIAESLTALDACPCSLEGADSQCTCRFTNEKDPRDVGDYSTPQIPADNLYHLDPTCLTALNMIQREEESEHYLDDAQSLAVVAQGNLPPLENHPSSETADQPMSAANPSPKTDRAERRRIQKRLYMRCKRAEAVGRMANTVAVRLRPGRQVKDRKPAKPRPTTYKPRLKPLSQVDASDDGEHDDLEMDEDLRSSPPPRRSPSHQQEDSENEDEESATQRRTRGGIARPYKFKQLFHEQGVTAQALSEMDLDLFNLRALASLLRLNNSLNAPSRKPDGISISVECLRLLRDTIQDFSSKIIQRAIIMKEQEIRLKANLKVWKYDRQEISVENMLECLKAMGLDHLSKERYFSNVLEGADDEDPGEEMSVDEGSILESENEASTLEALPSLSEGGVLSSDDDEDALTKELAEEDILDVLDIMRSREYEKNLWKTNC